MRSLNSEKRNRLTGADKAKRKLVPSLQILGSLGVLSTVFAVRLSKDISNGALIGFAVANASADTVLITVPILVLSRQRLVNNVLSRHLPGWDTGVYRVHALMGASAVIFTVLHGSMHISQRGTLKSNVTMSESGEMIIDDGHGHAHSRHFEVSSVGHDTDDQYSKQLVTGFMMLFSFLLTSALPFFRHRMQYKNFIYAHSIIPLLMIIMFFVHDYQFKAMAVFSIGVPAVLSISDFLFKCFFRTYQAKLLPSSSVVGGELVQLHFSKSDKFDPAPGESVDLRIQRLGIAWHPASIANVRTNESSMMVIFKKEGPWTTRLYSEVNQLVGDSVSVKWGKYSPLQRGITEKIFSFVSGGIGITPFLSILANPSDQLREGHIISREATIFSLFISFLTYYPLEKSTYHFYYTGNEIKENKKNRLLEMAESNSYVDVVTDVDPSQSGSSIRENVHTIFFHSDRPNLRNLINKLPEKRLYYAGQRNLAGLLKKECNRENIELLTEPRLFATP